MRRLTETVDLESHRIHLVGGPTLVGTDACVVVEVWGTYIAQPLR
jgi:hypothetical protein